MTNNHSERVLSILVCEDELLIMMHIAEFLNSRGYSVTETMKASEALAEMSKAKFDIIVADIELPDGSGVELAKSARATDPEIGVIFSTGHLDVQEACQIPSSLGLSKPFGEKQLLRAIRKLNSNKLGNLGKLLCVRCSWLNKSNALRF